MKDKWYDLVIGWQIKEMGKPWSWINLSCWKNSSALGPDSWKIQLSCKTKMFNRYYIRKTFHIILSCSIINSVFFTTDFSDGSHQWSSSCEGSPPLPPSQPSQHLAISEAIFNSYTGVFSDNSWWESPGMLVGLLLCKEQHPQPQRMIWSKRPTVPGWKHCFTLCCF